MPSALSGAALPTDHTEGMGMLWEKAGLTNYIFPSLFFVYLIVSFFLSLPLNETPSSALAVQVELHPIPLQPRSSRAGGFAAPVVLKLGRLCFPSAPLCLGDPGLREQMEFAHKLGGGMLVFNLAKKCLILAQGVMGAGGI